jgi:hypothetical protein
MISLMKQYSSGASRNRRGAIGETIMRTNLQENLARHLCDSIERLHKQVEQVEFWASAVSGLTQPVPEYEPETTAIGRYVKPGRPARKRHRRRSAANQNEKPDPDEKGRQTRIGMST